MSGSLTQFGIGKETAWGTGVAVDKSFEIMKESIKGKYSRVQAKALSAAWVDRVDRSDVYTQGAAGSVDFEPLSKGFGHWLHYMLGKVTTTADTPESGCYQHVGEIDNLYDSSLTVQVGRAQDDGTVKPWTYEGGRVTGWEISNAYEETLQCSIEMDFAKESNPDSPTGIYVLQSLSPISGAEIFTWKGGYLEVNSTAIDIHEISVKMDNKLLTERPFINSTKTKKQPVQDGKRDISWSFKCDYVNNDWWEMVSAATLAGSYADLVMEWEAATLLGATEYPSIKITIPVARFDEGGPVVEGEGMLDQTFTGKGLYDGTNSAVEIEVISADTTVLPN